MTRYECASTTTDRRWRTGSRQNPPRSRTPAEILESLFLTNLASPPLLFFFLGAAIMKSDWVRPNQIGLQGKVALIGLVAKNGKGKLPV